MTPVKLTSQAEGVLWGSELCVSLYHVLLTRGEQPHCSCLSTQHHGALPTELSLQLKYQLSLSCVSTPLQVNSVIPPSSAILQMLAKSICHVDFITKQEKGRKTLGRVLPLPLPPPPQITLEENV